MRINPHALGLDAEGRKAFGLAAVAERVGYLSRSPVNTRASSRVDGVVSTTSTSFVSLGGPSVTLRVPEYASSGGQGFVLITADVEFDDNPGRQFALAAYNADMGITAQLFTGGGIGSNVWQPYSTTPAYLYAVTPGIRTFELYYKSPTGATTTYRNRRLIVRAY